MVFEDTPVSSARRKDAGVFFLLAMQSRRLHPVDAVHGLGCFPTSILQSKMNSCIYSCSACGYNVIDETKIVSSKTVIWLCRFPQNSNIEVLTGAKRFIFLTPYSLASFCERFQVSNLIHTMLYHRRIGSDFLFCIIVYNTWTKRVGNLDYESINFCCGNRYTVVKGGE